MSDLKKNGTLIQRITQVFTKNGGPAPVAVTAAATPAESEEKKQERLAAYQKFCAEQKAKEEAEGVTSEVKSFKYRAPDFNK